jgi:hypothetical protein
MFNLAFARPLVTLAVAAGMLVLMLHGDFASFATN